MSEEFLGFNDEFYPPEDPAERALFEAYSALQYLYPLAMKGFSSSDFKSLMDATMATVLLVKSSEIENQLTNLKVTL